jgi:hypothetical protein
MLLYIDHVTGDILPAADWTDNWDLAEHSVADLGPYVISGLVPSIGTGLSVDVTAGVASIGGRVTFTSFSISSLSPSTTNHLYVTALGVGTSNTTGTAPADSAKIGTALTGASTVTSVATTWASGRQFHVKNKDEVHGGGAGHPRPVDISDWSLAQTEGFEVFGVLPAGAIPGGGGSLLAQSTKTANYTATNTDYYLWVDANGGAVTNVGWYIF